MSVKINHYAKLPYFSPPLLSSFMQRESLTARLTKIKHHLKINSPWVLASMVPLTSWEWFSPRRSDIFRKFLLSRRHLVN